MTTLEQKQQAAYEAYENREATNLLQMKIAFVNGAEWAEAQQRWIPVTERLPELGKDGVHSDDILFVCAAGGRHYGFYRYIDNSFRSYIDVRDRFNATYWQPLPEPPAQEGGQDE